MTDLASFATLIAAVAPWRHQLVVIGGWAHRLHRLHPNAEPTRHAPLITLDADLAFSDPRTLQGDIKSALEAAGFRQNLFGEHRPPVSHFELGERAGGFYAEFLTPLRGSGIRRTGGVDATVAAAGVTAQKLRHLELLLTCPWTVRLASGGPVPVDADVDVRIPNPVSFIVQKLLIHAHRQPDKRAQDVLYIHDTLTLFHGHEQALRELWRGKLLPSLSRKQVTEFNACLDKHFTGVNDTFRRAATIPTDRMLEPGRIQALCENGLLAICR